MYKVKFFVARITYHCLIILLTGNYLNAQKTLPDSIVEIDYQKKYDQFYDSLKYKSERNKFTKWLHGALINEPRKIDIDKKALSLNYLNNFDGKIIKSIHIKPLEVFGPTFNDTTLRANSKLEKVANRLHTKTNLKIIHKNLLFKEGDALDPEIIYENERILRLLPFIKDVRIIANLDSLYSDQVTVTVLTKDVFSIGFSGYANGLSSAALEIYNRNMFGAGHQISAKMVGHLSKEPFLGIETGYSINNINGNFVNISVNFSNTYKKEGLNIKVEKEFLSPSTQWAGGVNSFRLSRTNSTTPEDPIQLEDPELDLFLWDTWAGKSFQLNRNKYSNSQFVVSGRLVHQTFYDRPDPDIFDNQYFSNSTFYLMGLSWSQRRFMRDQQIYSYGITEDIPEGYKNELVFGYDANEFGNRFYSHLYFSNGSMLARRPGYLYMSAAIGGYFKKLSYEQGIIQMKAKLISRLFDAGKQRLRFFGTLDYTLGIRRFEVENLLLRNDSHIRGFTSREVVGKQRLSLNSEHVLFVRRELYKFNIALFTFADIGIIGSNNELVFNGDYYGGFGFGLRLHNESLVLNSIQLRLAFYPKHPEDMSLVGFILEEQTKKSFYNFQPGPPETLIFH